MLLILGVPTANRAASPVPSDAGCVDQTQPKARILATDSCLGNSLATTFSDGRNMLVGTMEFTYQGCDGSKPIVRRDADNGYHDPRRWFPMPTLAHVVSFWRAIMFIALYLDYEVRQKAGYHFFFLAAFCCLRGRYFGIDRRVFVRSLMHRGLAGQRCPNRPSCAEIRLFLCQVSEWESARRPFCLRLREHGDLRVPIHTHAAAIPNQILCRYGCLPMRLTSQR